MIPSWEDSECWALVPSGAGWSLRQNIRLSGERQGHGSYSILYPINSCSASVMCQSLVRAYWEEQELQEPLAIIQLTAHPTPVTAATGRC